jgi:hypothetical protein
MPQTIGLVVLAGVVSAAFFLALLTGLPGMVVLAYLVQLPLLFIGFTMGLTGSVVALGAAVVVVGLIAGAVAALIYAMVQGLPALVVVRQALLNRPGGEGVEWYPTGLVLAQLTVIAALGIAVAFVLFLGEPGGLRGAIEGFLTTALTELGALDAGAGVPPELARWVFLFPGLMASSWLIMVVVNAVLAQAMAVRAGWNRRPTPDFAALELPGWLWPAVAAAVVLALFGEGLGFLGSSMLIVLTVPYVFLGLAVIHALTRRWARPGLARFAIYGSIALLGWPILGVLLLGLVEDWAQLRRRFV